MRALKVTEVGDRLVKGLSLLSATKAHDHKAGAGPYPTASLAFVHVDHGPTSLSNYTLAQGADTRCVRHAGTGCVPHPC